MKVPGRPERLIVNPCQDTLHWLHPMAGVGVEAALARPARKSYCSWLWWSGGEQ